MHGLLYIGKIPEGVHMRLYLKLYFNYNLPCLFPTPFISLYQNIGLYIYAYIRYGFLTNFISLRTTYVLSVAEKGDY